MLEVGSSVLPQSQNQLAGRGRPAYVSERGLPGRSTPANSNAVESPQPLRPVLRTQSRSAKSDVLPNRSTWAGGFEAARREPSPYQQLRRSGLTENRHLLRKPGSLSVFAILRILRG